MSTRQLNDSELIEELSFAAEKMVYKENKAALLRARIE